MFDWTIGGLGSLFGWIGDAAGEALGWAWDKVITGIYRWLANGIALMIEWVWSILDSASTPRLTAGWFQNDLAVRVGVIAFASTVGGMLISAAQAALAGRPEQIGDAVKEGIKSVVASAFTITSLDVLMGVTDEASQVVWQSGRPDLVRVIEGIVNVATVTGPLATTFVGPLAMLVGFIGLIGLIVALMMRSTLIYVVAAFAPIVWSLGVMPSFRAASRKLVHVAAALVLSKLAIVIALVVGVKLLANPSGDPDTTAVVNDAAAAVGTLMSGFVAFLIAAVTPIVLYKLMPVVEGAMVGSGVASGWMRGATTVAHTALMVKSLGASHAASAATRPVTGQAGVPGIAGGAGAHGMPGATGGGSVAAGAGSSGGVAASGSGGAGASGMPGAIGGASASSGGGSSSRSGAEGGDAGGRGASGSGSSSGGSMTAVPGFAGSPPAEGESSPRASSGSARPPATSERSTNDATEPTAETRRVEP